MNHKNSMLQKITYALVFFVFGMLTLIPQDLYSEETGLKYFKNYNPLQDYKHLPQNWGIVQDSDGIIYVANLGGVLIYDGVSWRIRGIPEYATVRSLAIDEETGTVYIGGIGEIGYLKSDEAGVLHYVSLMDRLKEAQRDFTDVWRTIATKEGIYFWPSDRLLRFDPESKQMKEWKPTESAHSFLYPFKVRGKFYIHQKNVGLMQMVKDKLVLLPGGEAFANTGGTIFMMVPYKTEPDHDMMLIGTRKHGFYLYDGKKSMPFPTEADDYLKENKASHGTRLSSGDIALATRQGGLVVIDSQGKLKSIFKKTSGIQDDCVNYIFEDKEGNLWLCLTYGITKIEYASPLFIYNNLSGLPNIVLSVVWHDNDLYVGTTQGLYVLRSGSKIFEPVPGLSSSCWNLISIDDSLLAATSQGVFLVKGNINQQIIKDTSFVVFPSEHYPGRSWCGTKHGLLSLIRKNDQWIVEQRFDTITQEIRFITEDKNGNVWLGTEKQGTLKVDFSADFHKPVVKHYDIIPGQSVGRVYVSMAAGHVMFATGVGIFRYDEKKDKFIPDKTLGEEFAGNPGSPGVFRIVEDTNKNIWFHSKSKNYKAVPGPEGKYSIYPHPFGRIPEAQGNAIYPDPNGKSVWFGNIQGLIRYDKTIKKNYREDFQILIRKVTANDKLIFDGNKNKTAKTSRALFPILEYSDRNLHFEFAAPFFEAETETHYQYFLEGYDDDWSAWNKDSKRDYTNLDNGIYTFRVRARNVYQNMSSEDSFQFKILPPWYKTWLAYVSYVIGFFLLMFLVVKWRSKKLEHDKQKLEETIKQRTKEINNKNHQLENQTIKLKDQSEKLKEMDQVKSRFFANISHEFRTPLTLILSPLEQMLSDSQEKEQKKKLKLMRRSSQRLLTLINQLLDLSRFDSGKMDLQAACQNIIPFLKGTLAAFQMVALDSQLELEFHSEEEEISLYFDSQKMEEVMYNLLINAIKFTPPGGKVSVTVTMGTGRQDQPTPEADFVNISVQDTGPGIPQEQLLHIFDRFYQAEGLKGRGHKGTGIGLALTKELVLLHQGKIDVHSQEGTGTEFVIQLPLGEAHLKVSQIVATSEDASGRGKSGEIEILHGTKSIEDEEDSRDTREIKPVSKLEAEAHEDKVQPQEKNMILVVEDETDVRKYIRASLEDTYTVEEAKNGKEGIAKAREIIPDLIVSDVMMPETDGYELCRSLKKDINTSHIPIVLLTAKASEESIIEGLDIGADDYITKPFNTKMLLNRIKNLIELRRQLQLKIQRKKRLLPEEISVSSEDEKFLDQFQGIIEKNLSDQEFNVDVLSKKLYMGRSTLFRKIQALTGETPNQFIISHRLERGAQLLKEKFGNVTEVAVEVGFDSQPYFSKLFKEKFHQTPTEFQTSHGPGNTTSGSDSSLQKPSPNDG